MNLRSTIKGLLGLSLGAPVLMAILVWVRVLLAAMGDAAAATFADRLTIAVAALWLAGLAGTVVALAAVYLDVTSCDDGCGHDHDAFEEHDGENGDDI